MTRNETISVGEPIPRLRSVVPAEGFAVVVTWENGLPQTVDVATVRRRTGLSQAAFSRRIGVSPATLRNWEQGRRIPEGPARVLLALLDRNPRIVEETLS